ncbi:MAG: nitronate monooxygenase [bacterium]
MGSISETQAFGRPPTWKNRVAELLGSAFPIVLGPMRLMTLGEMAAAVSACGGFGQIAASGLPADRLRAELKRARELTDRPVGVNIPVYRPNAAEALEIAIEAGVRTITTSAGDPTRLMTRIREAGLRVLHKVSSVKMGLKAQAAGVDGVIAMGSEAGGHVGRDGVTTLCLVPQLADALHVPVVAAGGIGDARGLVAAFALGAEGVEMGTRFVATRECPAPPYFKERICLADSTGTLVLGKGAMPIRVLRNRRAEQLAGLSAAEADSALLQSGDASYLQAGGDGDSAVMPCGQIAGLIQRIRDIREVFTELTANAGEVSRRLAAFFGGEDE